MRMFFVSIVWGCLLGVVTGTHASETTRAAATKDVKHRIVAAPGEEFMVEFQRDGDQITNPSKTKQVQVENLSIKVKLGLTSESPFPPPRDGAKRPYLSVENNFGKTLHFRAMVRMKGARKYSEIAEGIEPVEAGAVMHKCWDFDTEVEEVVLYHFKLSDPPAP